VIRYHIDDCKFDWSAPCGGFPKMSRRLILALCVAAATCGCATLPTATPIFTSAQPTTIVLATAIIAPEALLTVVTEAVSAAPESAVVIAAAATAVAPEQAPAIRAAVLRLVPTERTAIVEATRVRRRGPVVTQISIPNHENLAALVERATR
jgi:hypothetical protein